MMPYAHWIKACEKMQDSRAGCLRDRGHVLAWRLKRRWRRELRRRGLVR